MDFFLPLLHTASFFRSFALVSALFVWTYSTVVLAQYPSPVLSPLPMHKYQVEGSGDGDLSCRGVNMTALTLARQATIAKYSALKEAPSFDEFDAGMRALWDEDDEGIRVIVPATGTYIGIEEVIEYITLVVGSVNDGYAHYYDAKVQDFRYFPNSASFSFISPQKVKFYCTRAPSNTDPGNCQTQELDSLAAHHVSFKPCTALIKQYVIAYDDTQNFMATKGARAATTCARHDQYCTGKNRQFGSFMECMTFMERIPFTSFAVEIFNGNNALCRFKHSFMLRFRPGLHCSHVGRNSTPCTDASCEGKLACNAKPGSISYSPRLPRRCCAWPKYRHVNKSKCPSRWHRHWHWHPHHHTHV